MNTPFPQPCDAATYLAWEASQTERHELYQGLIRLRPGATANHNTVCGNLVVALRQQLEGSDHRVFAIDLRVHVPSLNAYLYPDVMVDGTAPNHRNGRSLLASTPVLVVEVLSDSTATWDRGGKFAAYRQLPSLQEYVLIDPQARTVELYRRNAAQRFELYAWDARNPGPCEFASVGLQWPLEDVFEGVVMEPPTDVVAA
ncbi:Uma2 family endonuclease [Rhodoferax sp. WC2427]|uniref:Uma2 family endonuclease n=1 Tax=Rhodoferax sp. WC2427 TaxID=3234144 RepID=UPI0034657BFC